MLFISTTGDLVALLLILITFFYLIFSLQSLFYKDTFQALRPRKTIIFSTLVIVLIHYLLAVNSVFLQEASLNDSTNFIYWADYYAHGDQIDGRLLSEYSLNSSYFFTVGAQLYKQFLSIFALLFGTSTFFFSCLTIFMFAISVIFYLKICILLQIRILSGWSVILFGGVPGFLIVTIEPYREIFMILFLMMGIYYGFKYRLESKIHFFSISLISLILFGVFHYAVMAMVPFIVAGVLFLPINNNFKWRRKVFILILFSFILITIIFSPIGNYFFSNGNIGHVFDLFRADSINAYIDKINAHKNILLLSPGGTDYYWDLKKSSLLSLTHSFIQCLIFYMFKPFIWEVNSLSSLVLSLEGLLRFFLIIFSIIYLLKADSRFRAFYFLLLLLYFFIESIWALGTINAGTASRHHLIAQWIIILLGGAGMIEFLKNLIEKSFKFFVSIFV